MKVSKLVLGTVQFGLEYGINNSVGKPSKKNCFEILDQAKAHGISELDTADAYGTASEVLKEYFQMNPNSFKVMGKFSNDSSKSIGDYLDISLGRLGLTKLDGYYFHRFSDFLNFKDYDQVSALKKMGKLEKLAVSLYTNSELEIAVNHPEVNIIQLPFNLLDRSHQKIELLKKAKLLNKEIYIRSAFLQGLFFMNPEKLPAGLQGLKPALLKIQELAATYKLTLEEMCLNYALHKNYIDKIIIGVDSTIQLEKNIKSIHERFPIELEKEIELIQVENEELLNPANWGKV